MLTHYNGRIDWGYFLIISIQVVAISLVPAIIIKFTKISKWYLSIITGAMLGLLLAVIIIKIKI